jgi:hypothetical protein
MLAGRLNQGDCAHLMTDSSTSAGWLCKTNFREFISNNTDLIQSQVHIKTARHHATLFLEVGIKEFSQLFPGKENNNDNAISCDYDCSACEITKILCETCCPSQLPKNFQMAPLPDKISLWLTALLLILPMREQLQEAHTRTTLDRGTVSPSTLEASESAMTPSLTPLHELNRTRSLEPLPLLSGKDTFRQQLMTNWLWEHSEIPSQIFLQPSGKMGNPTQPRMMTSNLASFYTTSSEPTKMKTQKKNNNKQSLLASLPKLQRRISRHCNGPSSNSRLLPFSLPCARVNTSRSNITKSKEPKSSASKTFDSSKMVNSSATTTLPWSMPTVSTSPLECRKRSKRTMPQHSCHLVMSPSAQ